MIKIIDVLPIKKLVWGNSLYFFDKLDTCIFVQQNSLSVITLSNKDVWKLNIKCSYKFLASFKHRKVFFANYNNNNGCTIHFFVLDPVNRTYLKKRYITDYEFMSVFLSDNENYVTAILSNGKIIEIDIISLEIEEKIDLSDFQIQGLITHDSRFYYTGLWYKVKTNMFETYLTKESIKLRVDLSEKKLKYKKHTTSYDTTYTSVDTVFHIKELKLCVHVKCSYTDNELHVISKINKDHKNSFSFEMTLLFSYLGIERLLGVEFLKDNLILFKFRTCIFLLDVEETSARKLDFIDIPVQELFIDKNNIHFFPVYANSSTSYLYTLDDFKDINIVCRT